MTTERPKFQQVQYQFTRHMRDPDHNPAFDEIEPRRMKVYADLLFNNVKSFLENSFPVLAGIIDEERWTEICRDYFKRHQARTPLFPKMPQEFLHYLADEFEPTETDFVFLQELAHYEWLELETLLDEREIEAVQVDAEISLLAGSPVLNPTARPQAYQFPVHRISKDYLPKDATSSPTYIVVYRDREDKVGFLELNPITARLIELMSRDEPESGQSMLEQIASEMGHANPEVVINGGLEIMQQLVDKAVLLGAKEITK
ncbi:MAG: putative DNA-binding domain-containing protein [Pseudomonadota bacterium]